MPVCVLSANGERLMPTENYGKVRHLLKDGRAVIAKRNPFTIQLTYDTSTYTQPIEMCVGTGYEHIGVSIKTKAKEVVSQQYDMLTNERSRHDDCRAYRRTRRNRLRYRAARFNNRVSGKKPGWIAPSLDNKVERHLDIISRYLSVMPVTDVFIKAATTIHSSLRRWRQGNLSRRARTISMDRSTATIRCGKRSLNGTTIPVCIAREA